jgi:lipid-binding SYLF domain-containing protein
MTANALSVPLPARRAVLAALAATALAAGLAAGPPARAASAAELNASAWAALQRLYATSPKARELGARSRAVLVFPKITKGGFVIGGGGGDGVLYVNNRPAGYYRVAGASIGFQAGVQSSSYAMFFVTQSALDYVRKADGWSIGSGPTLTVVDSGLAATLNTTTLSQDIYTMSFGQKGLMAGIDLGGSKISRHTPG